MAERRMFTVKITEADEFTALPPTTQCLYFHLCMSADDDGFSNKIRNCMFAAHADNNDLELLITKRFVIPFESGVVVIKHWRMHNLIRADRYHETDYLEEKAQLLLKDNGSYTDRLPHDNQLTTKRQPTDNQMATEVSIGKYSKDKDSIDKNNNTNNKHKHGEYKHVLLSDEDMEKLKANYQDEVIDAAITILDEYIETSGKKYKNHYLVLKKWALDRAVEEVRKGKHGNSESGTRADVESDEDLQRRYEQVMRQLDEPEEDEWA